MKLSKEDKLFSKLIREAADYTCTKCGVNYRNEPVRLQCSHHISRRFIAIRWFFGNATAHCARCHRELTDDPVTHHREIMHLIGVNGYDLLNQRRYNQRWKQTKRQREDMYLEMKIEYKRLLARRAEGVEGPIKLNEVY